jgi:hypothetical protein
MAVIVAPAAAAVLTPSTVFVLRACRVRQAAALADVDNLMRSNKRDSRVYKVSREYLQEVAVHDAVSKKQTEMSVL